MSKTQTLTQRDQVLFQVLGRYGLLTTSQVADRVFPGVQTSTVLRRLRTLEQSQFIYRMNALESGELVWLLTRKTETDLGISPPMIRPNRNGVAHDVMLTDFRMRLEALGLGDNFIPEWTVRRATYRANDRQNEEGSNVPDGMFSAVLSNGRLMTVAIELELNAKTTQRYEKIFAKYMSQRSLDLVWYFVPLRSFGAHLVSKWNDTARRRFSQDDSLIFTVLSDFETSGTLSLVHFTNGKTRTLEQFFKLPSSNTHAPPPCPVTGQARRYQIRAAAIRNRELKQRPAA